jgi:kynurenine formamidase
MLVNGKTLDQMPVDAFTGRAIIISVPDTMSFIDKEFLLKFQGRT